MPDLLFRPAEAQDSPDGARLILLTLHEFGDHLFGFGDHARAEAALAQFFRLPANRFSHQHAVLCQSGGQTAGILMLFNRRQMRRSMWATAAQLLRVFSPGEIVQFLKLMLPYKDEENLRGDELYIGHLAVDAPFRRKGIGLRMLAYAEAAARGQGKGRLSLLTEIENSAARALYTRFGFAVTDTIRLPQLTPLTGSAGDVRMEKKL